MLMFKFQACFVWDLKFISIPSTKLNSKTTMSLYLWIYCMFDSVAKSDGKKRNGIIDLIKG